MSVAQDLVHGAWARRSASVSGSEHFETQQVIWLQAGTCYADMRVPFYAGADQRCFTGRSGWDADRYRWTHHLDLDSVAGAPSVASDDVGELAWEHDSLIERGDFPTSEGSVTYTEVWVRLPGGSGPFLALEAPSACLVQVGSHAITVVDTRAEGGGFAAAYRVLGTDGWADVSSIGVGAESLPHPDDPPAWPVIHRGVTEDLV